MSISWAGEKVKEHIVVHTMCFESAKLIEAKGCLLHEEIHIGN